MIRLARLFLSVWLLLVPAAVTAATYSVTPDRDSFMREDRVNENHGSDTELILSANASGANRRVPIYGFTLPAIPANEIVTSATLQLWVRRADTISAGVHRVTDSWSEATVTWGNTGSDIAAAADGSFTPSTNNAYVSVSLTSLVAAWRNGSVANHGIAVLPGTNMDSRLTAREWATAAQRPVLTITTAVVPPLTVVKSSQAYSDPYNTTTNPKLIPGALAAYTVSVSNTGPYTISNDSVVITDATPPGTRLFVGNIPGGTGPVLLTAGGSALTYTFTSLASTTDDVDFSNNGGATWTYIPTPDASNADANVTNIRIRPKGTMAAASSFSLLFGYQVQ